MKITVVTCVKNEGPFLLEWIAFQRVIGVTDFLFYSNDCTDGTVELLTTLEKAGIVHHLPNPAQGRKYQMEALKHAPSHHSVSSADWVWISDVDEFLNIKVGDGRIDDLIEACGHPSAISVMFQYFSNCDIEQYFDVPVIKQFNRSHNPDIWCDSLAMEVKTLTKKDFPLQYYGAHRPFLRRMLPRHQYPTWTDGSGRAVHYKFLTAENKDWTRQFHAAGSRDFATLNHYALRSAESFLVKHARGDVNRANRDFGLTYWRERNDDAYLDLSIQRYVPRLSEEIEMLKALPGIADLHAQSVAAHQSQIAALRDDPAYSDLLRSLMAAPKISPAEEAVINKLYSEISV